MRIDPFRRRRGSLSIEAVMVLPLALVLILMTRFGMEAMVTRQEVAIYTRGAAMNKALISLPLNASCQHADTNVLSTTAGVNRDSKASCTTENGELGLNREKRIFTALDDGASNWRQMATQISNGISILDVVANGSGEMSFDNPPFLQQSGSRGTSHTFKRPADEFWLHDDERQWQVGHDPVIWKDLPNTTRRLVPNLFPSRNG
jgi:hypothetical protein